MIKKIGLMVLLMGLYAPSAMALCSFCTRCTDCIMPIQPAPSWPAHSLVYCGNNYGYLTHAQYDRLSHYRRLDKHFILMINGEYVDSPCIPADR